MPTARELLEQADALMRRNRAAAAAAEAGSAVASQPVPAPNLVPNGLTSPRTIQHEPIAPSVERTSLTVDSRDGSHDDASHDAHADLPVLTEAVEGAPAAETGDSDDVPLLTDAVEEIDFGVDDTAAPLVDEPARGEVSMWLDAPEADASLLGPAPDSVAVVPPPPLVPPPGRDPLGLDQPVPGEVGEPVTEPDVVVVDRVEEDAPVTAADAMAIDDAALAAPVARAEPPASRGTEDEARIREIAEEIGMQVLQRIDIFTDTGLRERLGERLKPVIERVSADLVDALNQHVGELLREYVAEAIEREIETWRDRGGSPGEGP